MAQERSYFLNTAPAKAALDDMARRFARFSDDATSEMKKVSASFAAAGAAGERTAEKQGAAVEGAVAGIRKIAEQAEREIRHLENLRVAGLIDERAASLQIARVRDSVRAATRRMAVDAGEVGETLSSELAGALRKVGAEADRAGGEARGMSNAFDRAGSRIGGVMTRIKIAIAAAFSGVAIAGTARALVGVNAQMETYLATLRAVLRDEAAAERKLDFVREFAATTPFQLPDLVEAATRLEAYGIRTEDVLESAGNAAAALGKRVIDGVEAIADAQTGEFERLKEFGIKAVQEGGETMLLYTDRYGEEQKAAIDRNNRAIITSTIRAIWNERYEGAMRERSETLAGTLSNLQDIAYESAGMLGRGLFERVKEDARDLLDTINGLRESGEWAALGDRIGGVFAAGYDAAKSLLGALRDYGPTLVRLTAVFLAYRAGVAAVNVVSGTYLALVGAKRGAIILYQAAVQAAAWAKAKYTGATIAATAAQTGLNTAMRANPIGALVGIVAALATGVAALATRTAGATDRQRAFNAELRETVARIRELDGAALLSEEGRLTGQRTAIESQIRGLRVARSAAAGATYEDVYQRDGNGPSALVSSGAARRRDRLAELDAAIADREQALRGVGEALQAVYGEVAGDLDKRIAFLEAVKAEKIAGFGEDAEGLADVNAQLDALRAKRAELESGGVLGPASNAAAAKANAEFADALEAVHRAATIAASATKEEAAAVAALHKGVDDLRKLEADRAEAVKAGADVDAEAYEAARSAIEERIRLSGEALTKALAYRGAIAEAEAGFRVVGAGLDVPAGDLERIGRKVAEFRLEIERLERARKAGQATDRQYYAGVASAAGSLKSELAGIADRLEGLGILTPELARALREAMQDAGEASKEAEDGLDKVEKKASSATASLGDLSAALRTVARLGSTFGTLSDDARDFTFALADALDNLERLRVAKDAFDAAQAAGTGASALGMVAPALGVGAAVASAVMTLVGAFRQAGEAEDRREAERARRAAALVDEMRDARASLDRLSDAFEEDARRLLGGGIVGAGVRRSQVDDALGALAALEGALADFDRQSAGMSPEAARAAALAAFESLGLGAAFEEMLAQVGGDVDAAIAGTVDQYVSAGGSADEMRRRGAELTSSGIFEILDALRRFDAGDAGQDAARARAYVDALNDSGAFSVDLGEVFDDLLTANSGNVFAALRALLDGDGDFVGIADTLRRLGDSFAGLSRDVDGAREEFQRLRTYGGADTATAIEAFAGRLSSVDAVGDALRAELDAVRERASDGLNDADRAFITDLLRRLAFDRAGFIGNLTGDEYEAILATLQEGAAAPSGSGGGSAVDDALERYRRRAGVADFAGLDAAALAESLVRDLIDSDALGSAATAVLRREFYDESGAFLGDPSTEAGRALFDRLLEGLAAGAYDDAQNPTAATAEELARLVEAFRAFGSAGFTEGEGGAGEGEDGLAGVLARARQRARFADLLGFDDADLFGALRSGIIGGDALNETARANFAKATAGVDVTTAEGRAALAALAAGVARDLNAGRAGDYGTDDAGLAALLEALQSFTGERDADGGTSTSATFFRGVTEVTATRTNALLEDVAYWTRRTAEALGAGGPATSGAGTGDPSAGLPDYRTPPIMPPDGAAALALAARTSAPAGTGTAAVGPGGLSLGFDVRITGATLSDDERARYVEEVGGEVMRALDDAIRAAERRAF